MKHSTAVQNKNLYEDIMHLSTSEQETRLQQSLDDTYLSKRHELNGNSNRPVYGSLYKSELDIFAVNGIRNEDLDVRQEKIKSLIGDIDSDRRSSMTKVQTVQVDSLMGTRPFIYKHCPATTFGMEEVIQTKEKYGGEVAHICMQLIESETNKAQQSKHHFDWFKRRIIRAIKRALGKNAKGIIVLERNKLSFVNRLKSNKGRLHLHAIVYTPYGFTSEAKKRLKSSFKELLKNGNLNNAVLTQTKKTIHRVSEGDESYEVIALQGIDLGIADYLCKQLDKPIVKDCTNLSFFNMGNLVTIRRRWRYEQLKALRKEKIRIETELFFGRDVGDIGQRINDATDEVPMPPELLPAPL